ncbi:chromosome segregation protein Csm1/Pcs1-domain-containing protein [Xylaria sp. FL1042]|nr:chromosome segregation protein Csm1/Pcs1-domain-containing protein [Xylaria sp. FL1042]
MPPAKKGRPVATGRVTKATRAPRTARNALTEKTGNIQDSSTLSKGIKRPASDVIDAPQDQDAEDKPRNWRGRPRANKAQKIAESEGEDELSVMQAKTTPPQPIRRGRKPKTNVEPEIPETQPEMEIPETQQVDMVDTNISEDEPIEELPTYPRQGMSSAQRPQSRLLFSASRRPVSASDSELNDPTLRRRIGELTRKHEALEAKYRDLREIGVQEAERNFDRLKKQSEERANTDKQLIAALKVQLAGETEVAKDAEQLRKQLEESQKKVEELQGKLDGMHGSLAEAKTEVKTLSTKLAAARSAEPANVKVPGSAMKNNFANNRHLASAAEAAAQVAQKKENLYGDLTGLLVCGVKRENDEEVFDCVQTGRNGTLHFKLSIGMDGSSDKFEDAQFMYMPQLDAARDEELIDTLPDYLVEEITFPRLHAAKFYSRVVKALSERPE